MTTIACVYSSMDSDLDLDSWTCHLVDLLQVCRPNYTSG